MRGRGVYVSGDPQPVEGPLSVLATVRTLRLSAMWRIRATVTGLRASANGRTDRQGVRSTANEWPSRPVPALPTRGVPQAYDHLTSHRHGYGVGPRLQAMASRPAVQHDPAGSSS